MTLKKRCLAVSQAHSRSTLVHFNRDLTAMQFRMRLYICTISVVLAFLGKLRSLHGAPCEPIVQNFTINTTAAAAALAAALQCENGVFSADLIGSVLLDAPLFVGNGTSLTLIGTSVDAALDGNNSTQLIIVQNSAQLNLQNMTVQHSPSDGPAVVLNASTSQTSPGSITARNVRFADNYGGGIYAANTTVSIADCVFAGNNGTALEAFASTMSVADSLFNANLGRALAAGMYSNVTIERCVIQDTQGTPSLRASSLTLSLSGVLFKNNSAVIIDYFVITTTVDNCIFDATPVNADSNITIRNTVCSATAESCLH
jgi:Right handed beta helix region